MIPFEYDLDHDYFNLKDGDDAYRIYERSIYHRIKLKMIDVQISLHVKTDVEMEEEGDQMIQTTS